jgi:hypothetical protein
MDVSITPVANESAQKPWTTHRAYEEKVSQAQYPKSERRILGQDERHVECAVVYFQPQIPISATAVDYPSGVMVHDITKVEHHAESSRLHLEASVELKALPIRAQPPFNRLRWLAGAIH